MSRIDLLIMKVRRLTGALFPPKFRDILHISVRWVFRHHRRYLGAVSSVLLGIAGFIVVATLRDDVKREFGTRLDLLGGATVIQVHFEEKPLTVPWAAEQRFFSLELLVALKRLPGVTQVSAVAPRRTPATVSRGERLQSFPLVGVDKYFWNLQSFKPVSGRFIEYQENDDAARVCVIGADVARRLFDRTDVAGDYLIIENQLFHIAGVLDGIRVGEGTRLVFVPLTTAITTISDMSLPSQLFVRCASWERVEQTAAAIPDLVKDYLHTDRLRVEVVADGLQRVKRVAAWIEVVADAAVQVAIILGGIGIWNVTSASVRFRTREIGLKKAVGAEDRDILVQFLTESVVLCLAAAVPGVLLGGLAVHGISLHLESRPAVELILRNAAYSLVFALALGVVAGLHPSWRASRMQVTEALRSE